MSTIFLTGFPGFLGRELLPRVLARSPDATAVCLVQERYAGLAANEVEAIEAIDPDLAGRIRLVVGDIRRPDLNLESPGDLQSSVSEVYHLAAVYDVDVSRELGNQVNLDGTRHVLEFAESCPNLTRLHYVSTCYVSGRYAGVFEEHDLDKGQSFNNFYEVTKFLAEVEVQERMKGGLPATVYRPSIVVGDSVSGATQKFDGPYFFIALLLRQGSRAFLPIVGDPTRTRVNLVPRDFVVDAITHLSGLPDSVGSVYHLADHEPLTVDELMRLVGHATRRRVVRVPVPASVAKVALGHVPGVKALLRMPANSVDYFVHPTHYTTHRTRQALEDTRIQVPPLASYLPRLVAFMESHPEIGSGAMV